MKNQTISYKQIGKGELIILLPPPICDFRVYCKVVELLKKNYRVVMVDLPEVDSLSKAIFTLEKIIRKGTTEQFHLVASSGTGWIAQYLVKMFGSQILSLVVINSILDNSRYGSKYTIALKSSKLLPGFKFKKEVTRNSVKLVSDFKDEQVLKNYFEDRVSSMGKSGIRTQMYWFLENRDLPRVIDLPILSIKSTKDPFVDTEESSRMQSHYPNITVERIATASHLVFLSHPGKVVSILEEFIQNLS